MSTARMASMNSLSENFSAFFNHLNPSPTYVAVASRAQSQIRALLESPKGIAAARDLQIRSFIQGSYRRHTAIHTINDVDIVALCSLSWTENANRNTRDQLFEVLSAAITEDRTYENRVRYGANSICIKVELTGVKVEVLPALRTSGKEFDYEPFHIFRPGEGLRTEGWEPGFARYHQSRISHKNATVDGKFIPIVKVFKHLRSIDQFLDDSDAVSFHLECLLFAVQQQVYSGNIPEVIERVLGGIAGFTPQKAASSGMMTPCRDKRLFSQQEWATAAYERFHNRLVAWHRLAVEANTSPDRDEAIDKWQELLGKSYFPRDPGG